jgi:tartrate dehydrogenase/decarboxylase/D-malate dehydrogenase
MEELLMEKRTLTPDLGGTASTSEVGDAFIEKLCKFEKS